MLIWYRSIGRIHFCSLYVGEIVKLERFWESLTHPWSLIFMGLQFNLDNDECNKLLFFIYSLVVYLAQKFRSPLVNWSFLLFDLVYYYLFLRLHRWKFNFPRGNKFLSPPSKIIVYNPPQCLLFQSSDLFITIMCGEFVSSFRRKLLFTLRRYRYMLCCNMTCYNTTCTYITLLWMRTLTIFSCK